MNPKEFRAGESRPGSGGEEGFEGEGDIGKFL